MAAAVSSGGSSVTLANGRPAAVSTMATSNRRMTQPGAATTVPMTGGAPATTATPPASARTPTAIAGATSGTTSRLTSGDSTARRPNDTRMIGRVAACAASETPRLSASQPGIRPAPRRPIHSVSGVAQAISPAVASDDSWNPASPISSGSETSRIVAAQASAAVARPARPVSRASSTTPAISAARTTEADAPAKATYSDDRDDRDDRATTTPEAAGHRPDRRRDDRDVPAGDGDDVADARRRERRGQVAIDPVAQADQDPGGQPCLRLRQDTGQRERRAPAEQLETPTGAVGRRLDRQGPST